MTELGKKIRRTPVSFMSGGNRLYGMMHLPDAEEDPKVGVILLSAGLKNRVGYGRLYVAMADYLAGRGFPVLRYDYHGCGDSDGRLAPTGAHHEQHADINSFIQTGLFADDTLKAIDLVKEKTGSSRFVLCGLCGGSNSAVYAASRSADVSSIVLINLPTALDSSLARQQNAGKMNAWQLKFMSESYRKNMLSPRSWLRFFTLRSGYKDIIKVLMTLPSRLEPKGISGRRKGNEKVLTAFHFNGELLERLSRYFETGRSAHMIFAENDSITAEYETYVEPDLGRDVLMKYAGQWEKTVIKDSNHSYTNSEWREQLFSKIESSVRRSQEGSS